MRAVDGASQLRLLTITGIVTVLVIRFYLARTGYPQLGHGTFHIAHALWGGLLLLAGLATALLFVAARRTAAVLGGIGLGLFIDEVGKLVSRQHDYFFPLAPALIYLVFAALLVASALWDRGNESRPGPSGTTSAAQIAVDGLGRGLSASDRQAAERLLQGRDDPAARAVRELLDCAPDAPTAPWAHTTWGQLARRARALATRSQFQETALGLYLVGRLVIPVTVVIRLVALLEGGGLAAGQGALGHLGALLGSLAGGLVSAAFAVHAARLWQDHPRESYRWFRAATLVDLLLVAVFNFAGSQWAALVFLPANLLVLGMVSGALRTGRVPAPPDRHHLLRALAAVLARVRVLPDVRTAARRAMKRLRSRQHGPSRHLWRQTVTSRAPRGPSWHLWRQTVAQDTGTVSGDSSRATRRRPRHAR